MTMFAHTVPASGEYHPYYKAYIDRTGTGDILYYLEKQGEAFTAFISSIEEDKITYSYEEGKWTVGEVLAHIIDGERIFTYRALAVARGETSPIPGFDENAYVSDGRYDHRTLQSFRKEFISLRASTLDFFRNLHEADWSKAGDVNGHNMSVRAIARIIGGHTVHHMEVLTERYLK